MTMNKSIALWFSVIMGCVAVATAQDGQSWTNSLGMKFVPVAGTSVQFSVWDTRVQDYQTFAAATGRSWAKLSFAQGPTHPAVYVSWDDANAFCQWLTEKERGEGRLKSQQQYRLPTDAEWSVAAGLSKEPPFVKPGFFAAVKSGFVGQNKAGGFPWGSEWPPPRGAGNYSPSLNVDDFENTSPVGSFPANRFGLNDMGGNVRQWCEDLYGVRKTHVLRGASWADSIRDLLLSSSRNFGDPVARLPCDGFRCVLESNGPTNSVVLIQAVANTNSEQLKGMDKVECDSLIELARQAQQTTDLSQQKTLLKRFIDESYPFLQKHSDQMLIWQIRAASALSLNDMLAGHEAGQKLLTMGAADSNDPNLHHLLVQLNLKGWLDRGKMEEVKKEVAKTAPKKEVATGGARAATYIVKKGDTLVRIANKLGINTQELLDANPGLDPKALRIGQLLNVGGK